MNGRPSSERLLRRSRAVGWGTAAGASLATVGLVFGVMHTASSASTPATSTSTTSTSSTSGTTKSTPSTSTSTVATPTQNQAPVGGTNGS
jgi:hypothetical protein